MYRHPKCCASVPISHTRTLWCLLRSKYLLYSRSFAGLPRGGGSLIGASLSLSPCPVPLYLHSKMHFCPDQSERLLYTSQHFTVHQGRHFITFSYVHSKKIILPAVIEQALAQMRYQSFAQNGRGERQLINPCCLLLALSLLIRKENFIRRFPLHTQIIASPHHYLLSHDSCPPIETANIPGGRGGADNYCPSFPSPIYKYLFSPNALQNTPTRIFLLPHRLGAAGLDVRNCSFPSLTSYYLG